MRRLYVVSVAAAAVVGIAVGVVLQGAFAGGSARASALALPSLHGQATWSRGQVRAPLFTLRDQHGRRVALSSFRGRPVVLAFMDSFCTGACPLEARQFAAAWTPLQAASRPQLVVVSVDPADTPRSVARAARTWRLPAGYEWLLGSRAELVPLWRAYRIAVLATKSGDIAHSDAFYVIDHRGYERAAFLTPFLPGLLTHDLGVLARE